MSGNTWGEFRQPAFEAAVIPLYFVYEDTDASILFAAKEAIYSFKSTNVRSLLPFVLDAIERERVSLFETGFFQVYFAFVNNEFRTVSLTDSTFQVEYTFEYERNKIVTPLSSFDKHELEWTLSWVLDILAADLPSAKIVFAEDLKMLAQSMAMALGKEHDEVLGMGL